MKLLEGCHRFSAMVSLLVEKVDAGVVRVGGSGMWKVAWKVEGRCRARAVSITDENVGS